MPTSCASAALRDNDWRLPLRHSTHLLGGRPVAAPLSQHCRSCVRPCTCTRTGVLAPPNPPCSLSGPLSGLMHCRVCLVPMYTIVCLCAPSGLHLVLLAASGAWANALFLPAAAHVCMYNCLPGHADWCLGAPLPGVPGLWPAQALGLLLVAGARAAVCVLHRAATGRPCMQRPIGLRQNTAACFLLCCVERHLWALRPFLRGPLRA